MIETVRHLQAYARGEPHELGVAAVVDVRVCADRFDAGRRDRDRERRHEVSDPDRGAFGAGSELDDLGRELVAHHVVARRVERQRRADLPRGLDQLVGVVQGVQV